MTRHISILVMTRHISILVMTRHDTTRHDTSILVMTRHISILVMTRHISILVTYMYQAIWKSRAMHLIND